MTGTKLREDKMYLWWMGFTCQEWGSFVIAPTRGRAKALFASYWSGDGEYTDVRGWKVKDAAGFEEGVYDMDCATLEALGERYMTEEEMDAE